MKNAKSFAQEQRDRGDEDPLGRHPVVERWEDDDTYRQNMIERGESMPIINPDTIPLFIANDLGCCGPEFLGQRFDSDQVQTLSRAQRAQLGHWTHKTDEGTYVHRRERGEISAEQRAHEAAIKGKGKAHAPHGKGSGKPPMRGETPATNAKARSATPRPPMRPENPQEAKAKRPRSRSGGAYSRASIPRPSTQPVRPTCAVAVHAAGPPTRSGLQVGGSSSSSSGAQAPPAQPAPIHGGVATQADTPSAIPPAAGSDTTSSGPKGQPWRPALPAVSAANAAVLERVRERSRGAPKGGAWKGGCKGKGRDRTPSRPPQANPAADAPIVRNPWAAAPPRRCAFVDVRLGTAAAASTTADAAVPGIIIDQGSWDCPLCNQRHYCGKGLHTVGTTNSFTCGSCGKLVTCRTSGCHRWVAVVCTGCNQLYIS